MWCSMVGALLQIGWTKMWCFEVCGRLQIYWQVAVGSRCVRRVARRRQQVFGGKLMNIVYLNFFCVFLDKAFLW